MVKIHRLHRGGLPLKVVLLGMIVMCGVIIALVIFLWPLYRQQRIEAQWRKNGVELIFDRHGRATNFLASMQRGEFDPDSIKRIQELTSLEIVVLMKTSVTNDDLAPLEKLPALKSLALNDTRVDDGALSLLNRLDSLKFLHLRNTRVTDDSVAILSQMDGLEELDVRGTLISSAGIQKLKKNLPQTTVFYDGASASEPPGPNEQKR